MIDDSRLLSKPLAAGIGAVSLLVALMIAIQLILKVITLDYYPYVLYFSFFSNVIVIPLFLYFATRYRSFTLPALAWIHLSMALMLVYFSQTYSPFTPSWAILILISSRYYAWRGFIWSSILLTVSAVAYIALFPGNLEEYGGMFNYSVLSVLVVGLTIFIAFLFVDVIMSSRKKNRELTNAQRSEQMQVNRLNTLLNSISDAVMTLNRYGRVTSQNAAAQAFFDTNESLVGREVDKLLYLKDDDNNPVNIRSLIDTIKSSLLRDDVSVGSKGDVRHLSLQMSRIRSTFDDNEEYGVVLIIRDITKQKTLEEEKDEFISVTSHELRTPVAIAEGSLSNFMVMFDRHVEDEKLLASAKAAHDQIIYLSKMINDLSTLSRAERGVGDALEQINVNDLLHVLFERYMPEAEKKALHLNLEAESNLPALETSKLYLEEILQNFITNSIKYTKEGSVTIGAKLVDGNKIRFSVKDTGIGMSKHDLDHIFQKFYRSEDYRTRETSGTGLGLYVVEKLVMKLGIKIDVQSRLNHGSEFSFMMQVGSSTNQDEDAEPLVEVENREEKAAEPAARV